MNLKPKTELDKKYISAVDFISECREKGHLPFDEAFDFVLSLEDLLNEMHNTIILLCEERYNTPSITNIDDGNFVYYLKNYLREYGEDTVLRVGLICDIIDLLYSRSEKIKKENREKWLQTMKSYAD